MAQDATTFVAARSSSTALALPGATQPVDEDSALMRLAERPPLPRRRISLFWPGVLAAVAGLVAAMYWLTRPPERLALRVFDTAGQLRIVWKSLMATHGSRSICNRSNCAAARLHTPGIPGM
jgi:hypothetical protein